MPVLDSNPHDLTKLTEATPYGCKDREHKRFYALHQREYSEDGYTYTMVNTIVDHRMSRECRYDRSLTDPRCRTCKHRGSGEDYDRKIREQGN